MERRTVNLPKTCHYVMFAIGVLLFNVNSLASAEDSKPPVPDFTVVAGTVTRTDSGNDYITVPSLAWVRSVAVAKRKPPEKNPPPGAETANIQNVAGALPKFGTLAPFTVIGEVTRPGQQLVNVELRNAITITGNNFFDIATLSSLFSAGQSVVAANNNNDDNSNSDNNEGDNGNSGGSNNGNDGNNNGDNGGGTNNGDLQTLVPGGIFVAAVDGFFVFSFDCPAPGAPVVSFGVNAGSDFLIDRGATEPGRVTVSALARFISFNGDPAQRSFNAIENTRVDFSGEDLRSDAAVVSGSIAADETGLIYNLTCAGSVP